MYSRDEQFAYVFGRDGGLTKIDIINKKTIKRILDGYGKGEKKLPVYKMPQLECVARIISAFPEVNHNYQREHEYNLWFVVATETPVELQQVISSIEPTTRLTVYNFPRQQEFYIGLWLHLSEDGQHSTVPVPDYADQQVTREEINQQCDTENYLLDSTDRKLISVTQSGFSIEPCPYHAIADNIGIEQNEVIKIVGHD